MDNRGLCFYLEKLLQGELQKEDYTFFRWELRKLLRYTANKLAAGRQQKEGSSVRNLLEVICEKENEYSCLEELISEFTVHLLKKKESYIHLLGQPRRCYSYIGTMARNFILDLWREKKKEIKISEPTAEGESKGDGDYAQQVKEGEILIKEQKSKLAKDPELLVYELILLKELFEKEVPRKEVKYFCYFLLRNGKKIYSCLWGNKSKEAIYKDISRKRKKVLAFLEKLKTEYAVSRELMEEFVRTILSEKCEELRSSNCKNSEA